MFKLFFILFWSLSSFANVEDLAKREELFKQQTDHHVKVVQKSWLDKNFLSELSLSISPSLRGFYYMTNYSADLSYRLFFNDKLSFHLKYAYFLNPINQEGREELEFFGRIPLELKYSPKQSYALGFDWYPFYAKSVFFNRVFPFDFYLSMSLGQIELIKIQKNPLLFASSLGMVHWWNKRFNTRIELEALHYRYPIPESPKTVNQEWNYRMSLSAGVLF